MCRRCSYRLLSVHAGGRYFAGSAPAAHALRMEQGHEAARVHAVEDQPRAEATLARPWPARAHGRKLSGVPPVGQHFILRASSGNRHAWKSIYVVVGPRFHHPGLEKDPCTCLTCCRCTCTPTAGAAAVEQGAENERGHAGKGAPGQTGTQRAQDGAPAHGQGACGQGALSGELLFAWHCSNADTLNYKRMVMVEACAR